MKQLSPDPAEMTMAGTMTPKTPLRDKVVEEGWMDSVAC